MKVLCLGDNSSMDAWAHRLTKDLAKKNNSTFRGNVSDINQTIEDGYYYTGILLLSESEILKISNKFNKLILLDQNIEQFSHTHIFVSTWKLLSYLKENNINIEIINQQNMKFLDDWQSLMQKNKSFCLYPWIKSVSYNNYYTLCTQSSTPVTKVSEMKEWKNDKNFLEIRKKLLAGEKIKNCQSCYEQEKQGTGISIRVHETLEWAAALKLKTLEDIKKIEFPKYLELRFSNKCNIKCRSCNAHFSHLIKKENNIIKDNKFKTLVDKEEYHTLGGAEIIDWRGLKRVYIGGGEPTVQPELYKFLRNCIENKNTSFDFRIGTNAVKISKKLFDLFKPFTNLVFSCSIDGLPKVDEYIRWGTVWKEKIENINKIKEQGHSIGINFVLSIWNIAVLGETLKFFEKEIPNAPVHFNIAGYNGDILSPFNFPINRKVIDSINLAKETKIYLNNEQRTKYVIDSVYNHYVNDPVFNRKKLSNFFYYNDTLDKHRGSKLADYIPELESCRKYLK